MPAEAGRDGDGPRLLAGGNPQIPKGDGEAPVRAYLDAMPGWKRDVGERLHALIVDAIPDVAMAVKWNNPLYGVEGDGWLVSFRCFTRTVKLTFFRGADLDPVPPGAGKDPDARWLDLAEDDDLDEEQLVDWLRQAAALPGAVL